MNKGKEENIVVCIYEHFRVSTKEFNNQFIMSDILEKISFENRELYILGDFSISLLNFKIDIPTAEFLNTVYSNSFAPYITLPTCITPSQKH